jgi:hypothetical protein
VTRLPCLAVIDRRFVGWAAAWSVISLLAYGVVSAIIPNPVFGRQIAPEPFAIAVWVASAPLMGLVLATYTAPAPVAASAVVPLSRAPAADAAPERTRSDGSTLGALAGLGAFLAIGCPVCNKAALLLLGTSGAMSVWAPIQPILGAASLALLGGTLAWRMRLRIRGGTCAV